MLHGDIVKTRTRSLSTIITLLILGLWMIVGPWPKSLELAVLYTFSQHRGLTVSDIVGFMFVVYSFYCLFRGLSKGTTRRKNDVA